MYSSTQVEVGCRSRRLSVCTFLAKRIDKYAYTGHMYYSICRVYLVSAASVSMYSKRESDLMLTTHILNAFIFNVVLIFAYVIAVWIYCMYKIVSDSVSRSTYLSQLDNVLLL